MNKIDKANFRKGFVNLLGAFGYLFCALQWLWAMLLYFSLINSLFLLISANSTKINIDKTPAAVGPSVGIPFIAFSVIIIVVMLALTIYVIFKVPSTIVKTGKKLVNETAEDIMPLLLKAQHKKDTKKRHLKLTSLLVLIIKIGLLITPLALSLLSRFLEKQMFDYNVVIFISLWLAGFSFISFCLQYLLAKVLAVKRQDIW